MRSSNGCWTCRLRRKKCDEHYPVCDACAALYITCHYDQDKPHWMDGGVKQEGMAGRLKREIKAHRRRGERAFHIPDSNSSDPEVQPPISMELPEASYGDLPSPVSGLSAATAAICSHEMESPSVVSATQLQVQVNTSNYSNSKATAFGQSDYVLITFYLENVLPFIFPFYRPSPLRGGKAWLLEMMLTSPVVRQTALCHSAYFFSLARGNANYDTVWERVLEQSKDAFVILREALQVIDGSTVTEHLQCIVRVMIGIIQVQRFEIAVSSFHNCQSHLNAALALFRQLITSAGLASDCISSFNSVLDRLGLSSQRPSPNCVEIPGADQAAFCFSSAVVILDDIIASTVLQQEPRLYEYHHGLLDNTDNTSPTIDLEAVTGCKNWALLYISEIAALDAWKQQRMAAGSLDILELVQRATAIKEPLLARLLQLDDDLITQTSDNNSLLYPLENHQQSETQAGRGSLVTRIWAHAALAYLFVVLSGWQPANVDIRRHIDQIIQLLTCHISPPALLRTMVWPFCVAGCLAEPRQEASLRGMVEELQPRNTFGAVNKALEIMENVWRRRDSGDIYCDLSTCFRSQGDLVLLV